MEQTRPEALAQADPGSPRPHPPSELPIRRRHHADVYAETAGVPARQHSAAGRPQAGNHLRCVQWNTLCSAALTTAAWILVQALCSVDRWGRPGGRLLTCCMCWSMLQQQAIMPLPSAERRNATRHSRTNDAHVCQKSAQAKRRERSTQVYTTARPCIAASRAWTIIGHTDAPRPRPCLTAFGFHSCSGAGAAAAAVGGARPEAAGCGPRSGDAAAQRASRRRRDPAEVVH